MGTARVREPLAQVPQHVSSLAMPFDLRKAIVAPNCCCSEQIRTKSEPENRSLSCRTERSKVLVDGGDSNPEPLLAKKAVKIK